MYLDLLSVQHYKFENNYVIVVSFRKSVGRSLIPVEGVAHLLLQLVLYEIKITRGGEYHSHTMKVRVIHITK